MSNVMQILHELGINPFAVELLCESFLKSPAAGIVERQCEPLKIAFPINRSDCAAWAGVQITLKPVRRPVEGTPG